MARKSDAVRLAEIRAQSELWHDARAVVTDPLWSSILGFILIHEARKANLVGPVADDMLYAGVIAINTTRAGITREAREGISGALQGLSGALQGATNLIPMIAGAI